MLRRTLFWAVLGGVALALVLLFNYWAPWQPASLALYTCFAVVLFGLLCSAFPLRFLGIRRRRTGMLLFASGALLAIAVLAWPAPLVRVQSPQTKLDGMLPEYHFSEFHEVRVNAPPDQVMEAVRQATFGDIPAYVALVRIRAAAMRQAPPRRQNADSRRILDTMSNPHSAFLPLVAGERELVYGMAGQPWSKVRQIRPQSPADYRAYSQPNSVKVAFNLRVEDLGSGSSLLTTETRILALDSSARRKMGFYWRLIDPGSGMIRRQWINSVRDRAERTATLAQK